MTEKTIAAISTPIGPGGIGIIRISGNHSLAILKHIFVRTNVDAGVPGIARSGTIGSHTFYHGHVVGQGGDDVIDEVLAVYMRAPKSYTREDVVEIHSHSGYVVLSRILNAVLEAGAHLAGPGEFTKRAFLNGRIDLTQAEAVIDLINAPCETAAAMAGRQLRGGVGAAVHGLMRAVTGLQARCEAAIEFDDADDVEVGEASRSAAILEAIRKTILPEIERLIERQKGATIYRDGVLLTIAGAPNVGKSSLLNQLVEKESAIVSDVPGTTRDIVREYVSINGIPVVLCDTAGIHDSADPIECIGIEKARSHIDHARIVLLVIDGGRPICRSEAPLIVENRDQRAIAVVNKIDIAEEDTLHMIEERIQGMRSVRVSAKTGSGIPALKEMIFTDLVGDGDGRHHDGITPNLRHRKILEAALQELRLALDAPPEAETLALALGNAARLLEEIGGVRTKDAVYDYIFDQFCIGK